MAALFLIGPFIGIDRVGAWQRVDLLFAYAWQIAVAFGSIGCWIALTYTKLQALLLGEREQLNDRCPTFECRV